MVLVPTPVACGPAANTPVSRGPVQRRSTQNICGGTRLDKLLEAVKFSRFLILSGGKWPSGNTDA